MALIPKSTFRLVKDEERSSYVYKEVPLPSPEGDELLVKVGKVALCGTDISLYQWNSGKGIINELGSEFNWVVPRDANGLCATLSTLDKNLLID